jgi:general secretion pathway protein E
LPDGSLGQAEALVSLLVQRGRLSDAGLQRALDARQRHDEPIETVITRLGLITERDLAATLAEALGLEICGSDALPLAPVLPDRLGRKFLKRARVIPIEDGAEEIALGMVNPSDEATVEAVEFATGKRVRRRIILLADFEAAYDRLFAAPPTAATPGADGIGDSTIAPEDLERLRDLASDAPVIRLVNQLVMRAVEARASDIHLEPFEARLRVRYRIDGVLHDMESPPASLRAAILSRVKIMAKLDIAERRLPQDGRVRLAVRGQDIDMRVATTPTLHGESVVLRILDRGSLALDFATLGFDAAVLEPWQEMLARPHGIMLVTGPTGSGKTTTLYASLLALNSPERKILTVEDPIEYQLDGINQQQVQPLIGRSFAAALRSFLRQDPDVMMVGEIRDLETAQIAVQAALTGHLILSTLHTNDAASAVTRLLDMGVEDYLITSTLNAVAAQRLVRRLCPACREPYRPSRDFVARLSLSDHEDGPTTFWRPVGCSSCEGTGFRGRSAILELLVVSDKIRELVLRRTEVRDLERAAVAEGMRTMQRHGIEKALAGITTIEEVLRVTRDG